MLEAADWSGIERLIKIAEMYCNCVVLYTVLCSSAHGRDRHSGCLRARPRRAY